MRWFVLDQIFCMQLAYRIRDIYSFFSFVLGHKLEESLKWEAKGIDTGFTLFIPNLKSIFSIYFCCDSHNWPLLMSLKISMPKIYLVAPRYFISNVLVIWAFNLLISIMLLFAKIISSTYNTKIMNMPLLNLLK